MDSTHTFNTAHFTDNERTVIEVYWEKDGVIRTENIPAKAGDTRYKNLMTHLNIDQLHENTYKYIRVQDEAYQNDVIVAAKERGLIYDVNSINSNIYKALVETLLAPFDPVEDKEKLFMTKLQIFEVETIKSSTRKDLKSKLRKAKTVLDAFEIAIQISKAVPAPVLAVKKKAQVVDIESTNLEMLSTDNADYIAPLEIQEDSAE
tara:strand:- start:1522 stop:2136 length:615 start_codon:yes stop_codon:yes gene_type:complete